MKSETVTVQHLFQDRRQYCVPFYQRAYVWTRKHQWEQLWEDIRVKAEARLTKAKVTPHFLGAVVLEPQPREGLIGVDTFHIIDGQQRLTTLQFALSAILLLKRTLNQDALISIVDACVHNANPETMRDPAVERFKVWPTFRDRQSYTRAMNIVGLEDLVERFPAHFTQAGELRRVGVDHPLALAGLWFFTRAFEGWVLEEPEAVAVRAECLIVALLKDLKVISIVLEAEDDAQIIFETLNGRGAQLHATDLIRNFLFMRADQEQADSESLYDTLWLQFESDYWSEPTRRGRLKKPNLEWFIHTSLQAELHEDVDLARLYFEYRKFANRDNNSLSAEGQLLTLNKYAKHYKELLAGTSSTPIGLFGRRIAAYDLTTLHPLALMISASELADVSKKEMFNDLASYLVRRFVCGLTAKNYNNVFLAVLRQLHVQGLAPDSLRKVLGNLTGEASRWPIDGEFRNACITAPLYHGRLDAAKMRSVLTELEAELRVTVRSEEPVIPDLANLDIDHILPRSWFAHWSLLDGSLATPEEAAEVEFLVRIGNELSPRHKEIADRQSYIGSLGNLTLLNLSVNREAQNFAFVEKRDLLIKNTTLRLNIPLIAQSTWNAQAITDRGEALANLSLRIWQGPEGR